MDKKTVMIVDDEPGYLQLLNESVTACGFDTYCASNVADARRLAQQHWEELDVLLLDMRLDDPNEPLTTGAEIGIEFRAKMKSFPPEALIYSSKSEIDYYRLALRLGAAAYLLKDVDRTPVVTQHVRVLALRRALNGENPKIAAEIARIAVHSKSKSDAIQSFCRTVLKPEFETCLGTPFVILFTEDNSTQNVADNADLPTRTKALYHTIQALAHGKGNLTEPFTLETGRLDAPESEETASLLRKLNLADFLPLSLSNNLRLSIGLLDSGKNNGASTEAKSLCKILAQYLRPTVLENVINIWSQWTELRATRTSTAKLCLSVGQEINEALETDDSRQLEDLANDLNDTGQYLAQLDSRNWQDASEDISIGELVAETWEYAAPDESAPKIEIDIAGDCSVRAQRSDLEIVFSRLLQWFVYRSRAMPLDVRPVIKIECEADENSANIKFEDRSLRLSKDLREKLFAPFTQAITTPFPELKVPRGRVESERTDVKKTHLTTGKYLPLYLAKMLVEGRYHGLLQDFSEQITEHSYGHRIRMQIPTLNSTT